MERYLGDPVLGQFRGLSSFARNSTSDCTAKIVSRVTANKIISNLWSYRISSNLLEWKHRALRRLELRERLFDRCRVDCHDEMERDLVESVMMIPTLRDQPLRKSVILNRF